MSTQPGRDAWRDAGTEEPDRHDREARQTDPDDLTTDDVANLVEEALSGRTVPNASTAEDYRPGTPRPDLDGAADEADVAEQADEVRPAGDEDGGDEFGGSDEYDDGGEIGDAAQDADAAGDG